MIGHNIGPVGQKGGARGVFLECQGASVTARLISYCAHPGLGDCRLCDSHGDSDLWSSLKTKKKESLRDDPCAISSMKRSRISRTMI